MDARRGRPRHRPAARRRRPSRRALADLRGDATVATGPDGTVDVELTITNRVAFRSFVLDFLDHAEVDRHRPTSAPTSIAWLETERAERRVSPRPLAGAEIQRILALVPWIVAHPGTTKAEIAQRFGITVDQLDEDLASCLMIGVPPYSPGDYLDVEEDDDGGVTIRLADYFRRPLQLTPAEGLALLAAGRALLAVPGSDPEGPLATALAKLEARARPPGPRRRSRRAEVPRRDPRRGRTTTNGSRSTTGRPGATSSRPAASIRPSCSSRSARGTSSAYCHRAEADRMFRVDRIRGLRATGEHFEAPARRLRDRARSTTPRPTTRGSRSGSRRPRRGSPRRIRRSR